MSVFKRYFFILPLLILSSVAYGQAASSPFSTFGIGEPFGNALIQNQGMGGVGVSQPQFWSINNQNPALLVFNYSTFFQAGVIVESRTLSGDSTNQKTVNGNLNYLVTVFPVKQGKWTTSVGLMPFTKVSYKVSYSEYIRENGSNNIVDTAGVSEQGSGGLSQFYWSNGIRIHKNWAVGLKAAYLFGSANSDYSNFVDVPNQPLPFIVGIKEQAYVKDFMFAGGLSFSKDSIGRGDYRISAGAVYNFGIDANTYKTTSLQRRLTSGDPITSDTLVNKKGSIFIPSSLTWGFSVSKGTRWSAGTEFFIQDWSQFKNINNEDDGMKKAWKVSLGGEFTPDPLAQNYLKRITYRAGGSYEKTPFSVNNNQLNDFGINFGFSLPTGRSSLDWAFRIGKRGNKSETVLEETYYKVYFGITFNDQWFIKRKFD